MRRQTFYLALIMMWSALAVSTQAQAPGTFTAIGSTRSSGAITTATLLHSGKVLLTVYNGVTPYAAEIFDASTGELTPVGSSSFFGSHAVLLPTGKVLMLSSSAAVLYSELYNAENGTFGEYTQLTNEEYSFGGRIRHVHLMPNGNVLMVQISSEHPNIWEI